MAGSCGRGFHMRAFLPFGGMVVSRGLGSCGTEVIIDDTPDLSGPQAGTGRTTRIVPERAQAPKASIQFTGTVVKKKR